MSLVCEAFEDYPVEVAVLKTLIEGVESCDLVTRMELVEADPEDELKYKYRVYLRDGRVFDVEAEEFPGRSIEVKVFKA